MSDLSVEPVRSAADTQAFLRLPWTIYRDDPCWTPPLWKAHIEFFDPAHNAELKHIDMQKFVAWRGAGADRHPVGTVIAFINHAYNDFQEANAGWFGQFEVLEDREAAHALLRTAEEWVRSKGADTLMGPATFSTNSEIGLLVDGFQHPQMILTSHAPRYYQGFVESYGGFEKVMDLWCWHFDGQNWGGKKVDRLPEKLVRVVEKIRQRRRFTIRKVNLRDFDREAERVKTIYNQAWERNWGFIPLDEDEMHQMQRELKDILDPAVTIFVEVDGQPVAFAAPLPNVYQPLRLAKCRPGEPDWWQLLRLIWHWKIRRQINGIRAYALGVLKEYRASGIDAVMYYELIKDGLSRGYMDIEMSWILENNDMMNRAIKMLGAEVYKTYRVYQKRLG